MFPDFSMAFPVFPGVSTFFWIRFLSSARLSSFFFCLQLEGNTPSFFQPPWHTGISNSGTRSSIFLAQWSLLPSFTGIFFPGPGTAHPTGIFFFLGSWTSPSLFPGHIPLFLVQFPVLHPDSPPPVASLAQQRLGRFFHEHGKINDHHPCEDPLCG